MRTLSAPSPFGCLPNHICGKGMINKIRTIYPRANITPIDYDPGATRVNQENRIKLMLSVAKERLGKAAARPQAAQPRKCRYTAAWRCRPCTCPALRKSCPPMDERCSAEYRRKPAEPVPHKRAGSAGSLCTIGIIARRVLNTRLLSSAMRR